MRNQRLAFAAVGAVAFAFAAYVAHGSQGNLILPTTGTVTGVEFSSLVTQANLANASCHSGTTAPANATGGNPVAGQCWYDNSTTPRRLKIYDGTAWVTIGAVDATGHIWVPQLGGGTASIASAATVDLCSVPDSYINITGTTNITSFGTGACVVGQFKVVRFNGALTLTHGTNLQIQGSANVTTAANDIILAVRNTSTRWDVMFGRSEAAAPPPEPVTGIEPPIGTILDFAGFNVPDDNWRECSNQNISRAAFPLYVAATTKTVTATRASGNATLTGLTGADTRQLRAGMAIEGTGIPVGAQIASKTGTSVTMTANATSGGTGPVTFFAWGAGDGTTIGLPDKRGRVIAGRDDMNNTDAERLTLAAPNLCDGDGLGATCGNQQGTLTEAQLPSVSKTVNITVSVSGSVSGVVQSAGAHTHTVAIPKTNPPGSNVFGVGEVPVGVGSPESYSASSAGAHTHPHNLSFSDSGSGSDTVAFGSNAAHTRVQPTLIANCIVRVK